MELGNPKGVPMPDLTLHTAIAKYGHTEALKDGTVRPEGIVFDHVEVEPIIGAFRRMIRAMEFDISEMAITTYLCARSFNKPITAIPVFVLRSLPHSGIAYNVNSGIREPADLTGKRVGVRAYTVTSGLWARAMLKEEHGVDLDRVTWVIVDEEHVTEYEAPSNVESAIGKQLGEMLVAGEIDAAIGAGNVQAEHVKPLFPDTAAADREWLQRTGVFPINHTIVIKNEVLDANPWVAEALFAAFRTSKQLYVDRMQESANGGGDAPFKRMQAMVGGDPIPYGIRANRTTLDAVNQCAADQRIIPKPFVVEELFASSTVGME